MALGMTRAPVRPIASRESDSTNAATGSLPL